MLTGLIRVFRCSNPIHLKPNNKNVGDMTIDEVIADTPGDREGEFVGTEAEAGRLGWLYLVRDGSCICPECAKLYNRDYHNRGFIDKPRKFAV